MRRWQRDGFSYWILSCNGNTVLTTLYHVSTEGRMQSNRTDDTSLSCHRYYLSVCLSVCLSHAGSIHSTTKAWMVTHGHWKWQPKDRSHMTSYSHCIVTLALACTVSEIQCDIAAHYKFSPTAPLFCNHASEHLPSNLCCTENIESFLTLPCGKTRIHRSSILTLYNNVTDRQTDRQTCLILLPCLAELTHTVE